MKNLATSLAAAGMLSFAVCPPSASSSDEVPSHDLLASSNLLAWCIVPYDSKERGPVERIEMLRRLGIEQYVWDWREKHLSELPAEIAAAREGGIFLRGVWLWIDGRSDAPGYLSSSNRAVLEAVRQAGLSPEFWVGIHSNFFAEVAAEDRVEKGAALVSYLLEEIAPLGGTLGLYNHGDWFGQPDSQLAIIEAVADGRVGMVYNFHHEASQYNRFVEYLPRMVSVLRAVNLTGMPEGEVGVFPLGQGEREREVLRMLKDAGYSGPIGILGHVENADVEQVLDANLGGFRRIARQLSP